MTEQLLKASAEALGLPYRAWSQALLLALAGHVQRDGDGWVVIGQGFANGQRHVHRVASDPWSCDCEASVYNPGTFDLLGRPGRQCKHTVAVAIVEGAGIDPLPLHKDLWELLGRLVAAQHLPPPGQRWDVWGKKVRLSNEQRDGRDAVVLRTGRAKSGPLAYWHSDPSRVSGGMWKLRDEAREMYDEWKDKVQNGN